MYRKLLLIFIASVFIFLPTLSYAQRSIGKVDTNTKKTDENVLDIPVKHWIDKRFIFLEKPKLLQKFGYDLSLHPDLYLYRGKRDPELETEITYNLRYDKFVGKIIKVVDIEKKFFDYIVTFVEEESNMKIYAKPYKGHIEDIALFDDLAKARKR